MSFALIVVSSILSDFIRIKSDFFTPQTGQTQVSGISANAVPGAIPLSISPIVGS